MLAIGRCGNAIDTGACQRFEALANGADQGSAFLVGTLLIGHDGDLDSRQGCGTRREGLGLGLNLWLIQFRQDEIS